MHTNEEARAGDGGAGFEMHGGAVGETEDIIPSGDTIVKRLVANGYHPVPIARGTKACKIFNWPRWCAVAPAPQDIAAWSGDLFGGAGLACGVATAGIDIDTLDEAEGDRLEALAVEHFGATPLRRVGRAPKRALIYGCAERIEPVKRVGLDIIGFGQQLVAFAVHPDTGKPYAWGERTPLDTPVAALPAITNEQVAAFVEATNLPGINGEGAGGDGGKLQPVIRDPATGLVTEGREAHFTLCVWRAAQSAPNAAPEAWAEAAWEDFIATTAHLVERPNKRLSKHEALVKARALAQRARTGAVNLPSTVERIRILDSYPPLYLVNVSGSNAEIEMTAEDLLSPKKFQVCVLKKTHRVIKAPSVTQLNEMLANAEHIDASEDATDLGQFKGHLREFLGMATAPEREKLRLGHAWVDEKSGRHWFRAVDLFDHFKKRRVFGIDHSKALNYIRIMEGGHGKVNVGGKHTLHAWWVPYHEEPEMEPIPTPDVRPKEEAPF